MRATILCIVIGLMGCLPDPLPVDNVPVPETTVVVGSQNLPEDFIAVSLTESFNALSAGPNSDLEEVLLELLLDSLLVTIEVENETYPLTETLPGLYIGPDLPKIVGATYTMQVINPFNNAPVLAQAELLENVGFNSLDVSLNETPFDTLITVNMTIADPPEKNWYMVNVLTLNEDYDFQELPFTELLDDADFDDSIHEVEFTVPFEDYEQGDTVLVSMANISEEYYEFLQLRKDQRFSLLDGLGEPVNYPTNVQNGLGFFHTHQPDIRFFVFDE